MKTKAARICAIAFVAYLLLGALFFLVAGDSLRSTDNLGDSVANKSNTGELHMGDVLTQKFVCEYDELTQIQLLVSTNARKNSDILLVDLFDENGERVIETIEKSTADLQDNGWMIINSFDPIDDAKDQVFTLSIKSKEGKAKNAVSFYCGNTVDTGRFSIKTQVENTEGVTLYDSGSTKDSVLADEEGTPYRLCMKVGGTDYHLIGQYYWVVYGGVAILFLLYLIRQLICHRKGKKTLTLSVVASFFKYNFLIRQLVARDFKTKYKRSVLGMFWSFLNPLLTMSIQYVVFSTFFKSDIPNFIIYLLCGIICFNFFNESTTMCLMSILGNSSLINKVYVPKYIYPFSRTLSSCVNLLLSLVPLLIMLLITGTFVSPAALLLPFPLIMLFLLSYGIGLILATMMVFFRDTQFLWNIFSMLLMYLTPIFYPDTIIPKYFMPIYRLNPLYHVISFIREILMNKVAPEPSAYLWCAVLCFVPFLIGVWVFRKNEDKFVLNL